MIVYVHKLYVCIYCNYNVYNVGLESEIYVYSPLITDCYIISSCPCTSV